MRTALGFDTLNMLASSGQGNMLSLIKQISFKRHRFPPDTIRHSVWLYARFTLSSRDVEDMLLERGIAVLNETVRRWFLKFGGQISGSLCHARSCANDRWHLDEMAVQI
jgi:putative transposase